MHTRADWQNILQIESLFLQLEAAIYSGGTREKLEIPPEAFAWHAWDLIPQERLFAIMRPFLVQQLRRAALSMPEIYPESFSDIADSGLMFVEDWYAIPPLVKDDDSAHSLGGFRAHATAQPRLMLPRDLHVAVIAFGSGGSMGTATPTFMSLADRQREAQAWRRGHDYHGLCVGDTAIYTYNTTHKGGQWMQESLLQHGIDTILRRSDETADDVLENIRRYGVNVLFTVQQPEQALSNPAKSAGINLHSLIAASLENPAFDGILLPDQGGHSQVQFIFLGGFPIVPYARELVNEYLPHTPIATLLGSSEAIPQACSTNPRLTPEGQCHENNLHLLQGPHWIEIIKPEADHWVPVKPGETGLLVYTSWARDGTIWIRYAPGDAATLLLEEGQCPCGIFSPVITNVHRRVAGEQEDLLIYGCAAG